MSGIEAWLSKPVQHSEVTPDANGVKVITTAPIGTLGPQAGVSAPNASEHLPIIEVQKSAALFVVGAHGGAGETTIAKHLNGLAMNHAWPSRANDLPNVLVVARTNITGLRAAQSAARQWASGHTPQMKILGVVFMADAPGRIPKHLRELMSVVAGGYPHSWSVPWVEHWRTDEHENPKAKLPRELTALINDYPQLTIWKES